MRKRGGPAPLLRAVRFSVSWSTDVARRQLALTASVFLCVRLCAAVFLSALRTGGVGWGRKGSSPV